MRNNEPQTSPTDYLRRLSGAVRMAQSMEAVTADAPFARPPFRQRVGPGSPRQPCMKSSVEWCYLWNLWQHLLHRVNAVQAGWVVERGQLCQFFDCLLDLRCDKHGGSVPLAAMNNAMSNSTELFKRVQSC